jgi:hypothetical protein
MVAERAGADAALGQVHALSTPQMAAPWGLRGRLRANLRARGVMGRGGPVLAQVRMAGGRRMGDPLGLVPALKQRSHVPGRVMTARGACTRG